MCNIIIYLKGDLFKSPAQVLVNTVNTVGVMGKGVALEFKKQYPLMFKKYQELCEAKRLNVGDLALYRAPNKWILLFPTKIHWRNPSKIEYIEKGLKCFVNGWDKYNIESIAFPKLGCGNGGLDWEIVKRLMEKYLKPLPIKIYIYIGNYEESIPEHLDQNKMESWLLDNPQDMGFITLKEILNSMYTKETKYLLTGGEEYSAMWKDNSLIIEDGEKHIISEDELCRFWNLMKNMGVIQDKLLPLEFKKYSRFLLELFKYMNYIEPVLVSRDGKTFGYNSHGYQYIKNISQEFSN